MRVGEERKRGRGAAVPDAALQFLRSANAADEVHARVGTGVAHVQEGPEDSVVQQADIQ